MSASARVKSLRACNRGASAVEFAIVAPLFVVILLGIVIYGLYFGTALGVSQVAAEAARASVAGISPQERSTLATQRAFAVIEDYSFLDEGRMNVTASAKAGEPALFVVTVQYDASNLPIFAFNGLIPLPGSTIERTSVVQRGGY